MAEGLRVTNLTHQATSQHSPSPGGEGPNTRWETDPRSQEPKWSLGTERKDQQGVDQQEVDQQEVAVDIWLQPRRQQSTSERAP